MKKFNLAATALAVLTLSAQAHANITFYEDQGFQGRSFSTKKQVNDMDRFGFNNRASSVTVTQERWEVCEDARFRGPCVVLRPGKYATLATMGLNNHISSARAIKANQRIEEHRYAPAAAPAQVTFYENESFGGRSFSTAQGVDNFTSHGFNDRASSVVVAGDSRWEVCDDSRFNGYCRVLRQGQYPSLTAMGLNNRISSVREISADTRIDDRRYAPAPIAAPDYRQRQNERLYEANVTSVRAVVGTPEKRCWVEREQVPQEQSSANIPAAVVGALLGGVLGHQVGGGTGKDIATAGGVIAGAVLGSRVGGSPGTPQGATQDVQRCEETPSQARTEYWEVTYTFKGQDHRIQMTSPPGRTIRVNAQGEPRN